MVLTCVFAGLLLAAISWLSLRRRGRLLEQRRRWKDIKELEEDYDVYVSDEYAYHIADAQALRQNLANIEYMGINSIIANAQNRIANNTEYRPKLYKAPAVEEEEDENTFRNSTEVR